METFEADSDEFAELMRLVQNGSQDAAWTLIERIGPHIRRVVERNFPSRLRSKFDTTDFVQAVWASFFYKRDEIASFDRPERLVAYLVGVARHKLIDESRAANAAKRDTRREVELVEDEVASPTAARHGATPSEFAMARERWENLLAGQPALYQQIVFLKYRGNSNEAIAIELGINRRTVSRVLARLLENTSDL
jgi:RNA polymerase sigma factor (sigma-70 family)